MLKLFFLNLVSAQIGEISFDRCLDDNYRLYQNGAEQFCVPECKIGEQLDEDYYCVEMVYLNVGPEYLADAAEQSLNAIQIMAFIIFVVTLTFCGAHEKRLDRHDKFWLEMNQLNQEYDHFEKRSPEERENFEMLEIRRKMKQPQQGFKQYYGQTLARQKIIGD